MHTSIQSTKHRRTFACLLLLVVVSSSLFPKTGYAEAASPWLTPNPSFKKLNILGYDTPMTADMTGNRDCQPTEIITRPAKIIPPQAKESHQSCTVDTGFGSLSDSGYLQRQGSDAFGWIGATSSILGIPRTNNALVTKASAPHGTYVGFYDNLDGLISSTNFNGTVTHSLPASPTSMLTDRTGNNLGVDLTTLSFSQDGDWAVVEAPGIAMLRINSFSHTVLPFANAPILESTSPAYRTAVSAGGRYAVVISKTRSMFKLFDLSTCANIPDTITTNVSCAAFDLLPFIQSKIQGYTSTASIRFRGDYTLEIYANTQDGLVHGLVTASGQDAAHFQYLGLGDSFASGEGAFQYKSLTDTTANPCHLSLRSYPYLISRELHLSQSESLACSGAVMDDITNSKSDYQQNHAQAKGKEDTSFDNSIFDNFLPGYRAQNLFVKKYGPTVMTISIGGNNIGFSDIIIRCLGPDTCYSNYEDRLELLNEIDNQFNELSSVYKQLKQSSPESEKIYAVAYPKIADANGNCALNVHLNHEELLLANLLVSHLNSVIRSAAEHAGITYLDTEDTFTGYRLCETNSNHIAVNGLSIGNDILNYPYIHGPIAKESYHPNSLGHQLLAAKVLSLADNFSILNKPPKSTITAPTTNPDDDALKSPKKNRQVKKTIHKKSDNQVPAKKKATRKATTKSVGKIFKPIPAPKVVLDDGDVPVGTVTKNPDDSITTVTNVPDSTSDGPHTIDIVGENTSGEPAKVTETIVVGDSGGPCGVVPASGVDSDSDGIDDACDPQIGTASGGPPNNNPQAVTTPEAQPTSENLGQSNTPDGATPSGQIQDTTNPQLISIATPLSVSGAIPKMINHVASNSTQSKILQVVPSQNTPDARVLSSATSNAQKRSANQSPIQTASYYGSPKRLDFVTPRNLLFFLVILFLIFAVLIYQRRKRKRCAQQ